VGFLSPQNFVWAASLALLVLIYLRSRSRPTLDVSSLMLFDEAPAPVASVRHVRIDPLFWLEMAALAALTLALAGMYVMRPPSMGHGRIHALVFDLGAAMSARDGQDQTTRLDQARHQALAIVEKAPVGDEFSVIGYALDAEVRHPQSANLPALRQSLDGLVPVEVPARTAALRAALMRARGASEIDLFADRPPPSGVLSDVASVARVNFHLVGSGDANLAIVSLDPGAVGSTRGRAVIRNFSARPHPCELEIDLGTDVVFHQTLILSPREQVVVPFGPLAAGGVLRARILTPDALAADNSRYAYAASDTPARVLVLSPEAAVRDDLARVILALNSNFQIETVDPAHYLPDTKPLELVVMHDCYVSGIAAASTLLIYPPQNKNGASLQDGISVGGTFAGAELHAGSKSIGASGGGESVTLGATRIVAVPEWMDPIANAAGPGHQSIPAVAFGRAAGGPVGLIAFDVRNHLILAPDHLDALILTIDLLKQLTAPSDVQIVSTGADVSVPATANARVTEPDGSVRVVAPDRFGRVRIRPMNAGSYSIESGALTTRLYANYYDATESDLGAKPVAESSTPAEKTPASAGREPAEELHPLVFLLVALALLALMVESAILIRHATRWGMRHV
jgi:Aerotolerance regulator N-terminal